ncbi:Ankyrin repeats (3 copies)/Ankyrin repeat/Ankyrin repeats (many copies), putative [Leishmania lindenbergi]|uniref:Ankyrin repeat (3 copies)/Ankyrin repeat/Ankyrin repeat (Many copies) n=1 Tax=Leishmania lindenbergi TaxID=651832 RepID=A0AAW3B1M5_9TRYP
MLNANNDSEMTYFTAITNRDVEAMKTLIAQNCNVNEVAQDPALYHRTPLHMCVWDNFVEGAKLLLDAGADVNALDDLHDSPYLLSGAEGRQEIMEHIYKNAERTMRYGSQTSCRMKTSVPDYSIVNRFGGSALIPACERGHVEMVRLLVQKGVDVNHYNHYHWTGLLEAIELGGDDREHVEIVRILIENGADVNQVDGAGKTPLYLARKREQKRITALLEAAGGHE